MLTFKQSVVVLVSIITILAIIAIVTGLSPLYWPRPKTLSNENNSSIVRIASDSLTKTTISSNSITRIATRYKAKAKKKFELTTVKITEASSMTTNTISSNTSVV